MGAVSSAGFRGALGGGVNRDCGEDFIDPATYGKSVHYTLAKDRFGRVEDTWDLIVLLLVLFSGVLPAAFNRFVAWSGDSAWAMAVFVFLVGVGLALTGLPLDWYAQFRLEERFGFNTTTPRLWWADRLKGLLLALALGYPLLVLILKLVEWTGAHWWLWAWGCVLAFQLLMHVLAPVLIMPRFNKFTPLPDKLSLRATVAIHNIVEAVSQNANHP